MVGAVVAVAGVTLALRPGQGRDLPPGVPAARPDEARREAAGGCAALAEFARLVRRNAPADRVRRVLAEAVRRAEAAADADPRWVALSGGAQSLQLAVARDDAQAARVGVGVVRAECAAFPVRP